MKSATKMHKPILVSANSLKYFLDGEQSNVLNLGIANGFSVREVIATAMRITGCDIPCVESDRRSGDPAVLIGSSEKIRKNLGWNPNYYKLDTIIEAAWRYRMLSVNPSFPGG